MLTNSEFNNTYLKALYLRSLLRADFARVLRVPDARSLASASFACESAPAPTSAGGATHQVDVLLHPTAIGTAPLLHPTGTDAGPAGEASTQSGSSESATADEYAQDVLTVPASLAGLPALSVPAGTAADGWPVGVSVVSQWGAEKVVLGVAKAVEGWARSNATFN